MSAAGRSAVITGIGMITPAGRGATSTFDAQCEGRSGIVTPPRDHVVATWIENAGVAPEVDPASIYDRADPCLDRYVLLALAAADDAIADAGLVVGENADPHRIATVVSSGGGGLLTYEEQASARRAKGRTGISPYMIPGILPNMAAARIALRFGLRGYSAAVATACAAGAQSIADGLRLIRAGDADVVVCGGTDAPLHPSIATGFVNARATANGWADPTQASRPFDKGRNGFVLSEGSCVVVLESVEHANARGVAGYADLIGWGGTTDAHHLTAPRADGEGAAEAMRRAVASAGVAPSDVDYINAHGTSTKRGDVAETKAVHDVFGAHSPAVSATKSVIGHSLAAAGAIEAAVTALAIAKGTLPPTFNLAEVDPRCELDHVLDKPRQGPVSVALSNSFGFGGHNISLALAPASTTAKRFG
ncbi:beta-ketoacyl-[acyl-carrier-protein] synthase family protein [Actinokineospora diospyrosa]|uniref:3-oxoacyl-[acyl-carrier-protein] synthase II n=1 Tax=Actinokineospora diospyrosa TaxID=103728 RepID=A0ABT1IM66_9PSEU|nr:beta-ketoacyl-[acyl-carrier-protein] synthase family protein [Actinokineospora diospyrosa]MCP2273733.1 3-oxoacyl-[acyl-carrier-protein] synthase II [Actinokineospora diospyrosa]